MSRYFDIFQKSEQIDDLSSSSLTETEESIETPNEPPQIPVEEVHLQPESRVVFHTDARGPGADRFRFLRMRLRELWNAGKLRSLLITSPLPGDGKSTIALNLATVLAEQGKRSVLLVEGDLHHSSLTQQLGIEPRPGLAECLEDGLNPMSAVRRLEPLGWYLLSSGKARSNPTELLQSEAIAGIMQELAPYFDWILIDSPPVTPLTDALTLARQADAILLAAWAGRTPREAVEEALKLLGPEHVLGVLLNGIEGLDRFYSKYYGDKNSSATSSGTGKQVKPAAPQPIQPKHSAANSCRVVIRVPHVVFSRIIRLFWWVTALAWAGMIFSLSTAGFGGDQSQSLLTRMLDILQLSGAADTLEILNSFLRKFAHVAEYAVFSLLLYRCFAGQDRFRWRRAVAGRCIAIAAAYSLTDEFHQVFVPGRGASMIDCGIDTSGAVIAMMLIYAGWQVSQMRSSEAVGLQ